MSFSGINSSIDGCMYHKVNICNICFGKGLVNFLKEYSGILLDVRLPAHVRGKTAQDANIPNAYYTPFSEFINYTHLLPKDKTIPIIIGSYEGALAKRVKKFLENRGYKNVYILCDNIESWIERYLFNKSKLLESK